MSRKGLGAITGVAKDQLLAAGRATRKSGLQRKLDRAVPKAKTDRTAAGGFDFGSLEAARQLKIHRAVGEALGIESPFFRSHDGRAAAHTVIGGETMINWSSYDYVGLNGHPRIAAAAQEAIDQFGTSVSASRVVSGERQVHRDLEKAIARFLGVEDAVVMVSGHATNVTTIGHMLTPKDLVLADAFIHNSVVEGVRLSGATRLTFRHNDLDHLEALLDRHRANHSRVLIAVEGLYSMDGDSPPLRPLVELKNRYDAWLLVDEAHALGVVGATGRGLAERDNVDPNAVEFWMGTLSKTLCSCGGFIAGSTALVEYLKATAPGFVFSVGLPAASAVAAKTAINILDEEPERVTELCRIGQRFLNGATAMGFDVGTSEGSAVIPIIVGDSILAAMVSHKLSKAGVNVQPIIFPAVPENAARLRFFITSNHTDDDVDQTLATLKECMDETLSAGEGLKQLAEGLSRQG
ncbi:MAG: aminotransferase class I/II-fold pyridoxal phosphate-dependent enzyme [Pseudomonadota bacterium]